MSMVARAERLHSMAGALAVQVTPEACALMVSYLDAVLQLNEQVNLTAIRDPEQALILHALDSLAVGLAGLNFETALDMGSGNGFPGIALHALHRTARTVFVERTGKKCRAMEAALATAGVTGIQVLNADAMQLPRLDPSCAGAFDVVTARAVGPAKEVAKAARGLLRRTGRLLLWMDEDAEPPSSLPGALHRIAVHSYDLPEPAPRRRHLVVYQGNR